MIDFDGTVLRASMAAFGETILFQPAYGPMQFVVGVFNERGTDTKYQDGDEIVEERPTLGCRASDFGDTPPQLDDTFVIRGRVWRVADTTPDGIGHIDIHVMYADDTQANLAPTPPTPPVVTL